jgi:ADP-ribosylglycohydrolase
MNDVQLVSRLAGAVWGHLVGDAMGVPYEFMQARPVDEIVFGATGTWSKPPGTWSDDGALMLALLDSLLTVGFDPEDQGRRALAWADEGAYTPELEGRFDIGNATAAAMAALRRGRPAVEAGEQGESKGNGSLMRILPVALVHRDDPPAVLIERAHLASRVTHAHPACQVPCAVYVLAVTRLLRGESPDDALAWAMERAREAYTADPALDAHLAELDGLRAWSGRSGRGLVTDAFWSAWDAFAGAADYPDAIRRAIAYGNDTDTTAAIAGGLAGARWGWASIPRGWRERMRGREVATPLVDRLVAKAGAKTSTAEPLRVHDIPLDGTRLADRAGGVGITFLPGKKRDGWTGLHWRDLDLDLASLRAANVDAMFLMVEDHELDEALVPELPARMAAEGPELIRYPIRDPHTPTDLPSFERAIRDLIERIGRGQHIAIACRGGLDRSGMAAACLLRELGLDAEQAIARVRSHRRGSITMPDQVALVRAWRVPG